MKSPAAKLVVAPWVIGVALLAGCSVTACRLAQPHIDYAATYFLEVANDATEDVRTNFSMGGQDFMDILPFEQRSRSWSGIFSLESGERRTFEMSLFGPPDSLEDNFFVGGLSDINFYEVDSDTPYRSYEYRSTGCGYPTCWDSNDDTLIYHRRGDGTKDYLFVESPDRPFYLERDKENLDLGRLVITFVPGAQAGSREALE